MSSSLSTPINLIRNNSQMDNTQMDYNNRPIDMPIYNPTIPQLSTPNQSNPYANNLNNDNGNLQHSINNMLPSSNVNSSTVINDILNELEEESGYEQDMNVAQNQYAINDVNVPPKQNINNVNMLKAEPTQLLSSNSNMENYTNDNEYSMNVHNKSTLTYIMNELKLCLIVFILFVLLSLHHVNRIIFSFLPQLLLENGQLSLYAILLKGVIATLLFYGFSKLL